MKRHQIRSRRDGQIGQQFVVHELDRVQELHLVEALLVLFRQVSTRGSEAVSARTGIDYDWHSSLLRPCPTPLDRSIDRNLVRLAEPLGRKRRSATSSRNISRNVNRNSSATRQLNRNF